MKSSPRIYVASLADYNAGRLHGEWIDADQDPADIMAEIKAMLAKSKEQDAEEFAIHDFEGFESFNIREYQDIDEVAQLAQAIAKHGAAFAAYAGSVGVEEAIEHFEEAFQGEFDSMSDFAYDLMDSTGQLEEIPQHLRNYFDYEAFGRDLELGGDYSHIDGFVFNNHV